MFNSCLLGRPSPNLLPAPVLARLISTAERRLLRGRPSCPRKAARHSRTGSCVDARLSCPLVGRKELSRGRCRSRTTNRCSPLTNGPWSSIRRRNPAAPQAADRAVAALTLFVDRQALLGAPDSVRRSRSAVTDRHARRLWIANQPDAWIKPPACRFDSDRTRRHRGQQMALHGSLLPFHRRLSSAFPASSRRPARSPCQSRGFVVVGADLVAATEPMDAETGSCDLLCDPTVPLQGPPAGELPCATTPKAQNGRDVCRHFFCVICATTFTGDVVTTGLALTLRGDSLMENVWKPDGYAAFIVAAANHRNAVGMQTRSSGRYSFVYLQ